ncbi:hypothetical protein BDZ97DRAFT_1803255, partial [Flammula alnicola]
MWVKVRVDHRTLFDLHPTLRDLLPTHGSPPQASSSSPRIIAHVKHGCRAGRRRGLGIIGHGGGAAGESARIDVSMLSLACGCSMNYGGGSIGRWSTTRWRCWLVADRQGQRWRLRRPICVVGMFSLPARGVSTEAARVGGSASRWWWWWWWLEACRRCSSSMHSFC